VDGNEIDIRGKGEKILTKKGTTRGRGDVLGSKDFGALFFLARLLSKQGEGQGKGGGLQRSDLNYLRK